MHKLEGHNRYVTCCVFSSDNAVLATGSNDKTVIIWPLANMKEKEVKLSKEITNTSIRPLTAAASLVSAGSNVISDWTTDEVAKWLDRLGLGMYCERFKENSIDGSELLHLSHDVLITSLKIGKVEAYTFKMHK